MKRRAFLAAAAGALSAMAGVQAAPRLQHSATAQAFGGTLSLTVLHGDAVRAQEAIGAALRVVQDIESLADLADADSPLRRLNREGALARPEHRMLAMLSQACALSDLTGGAFDVTVQPLLDVYADALRWGALPEQGNLDAARALVGWRQLAFGREQVRFMRPGMALTLDGLAQGYAADAALAALRRYGICDALVDMGGMSAGLRDDRGLPAGLALNQPMRDRCMATAIAGAPGAGGVVDPLSGEASDELERVTVLAPLGLLADGLSTAFMVMGAKKAHALAARLPGIEVLTVDRRGAERRSAGFRIV